MGDPRTHAPLDFRLGDGSLPPTIPKAPQPVPKPTHVRFGQAPPTAGQQDEAKKGGGLARGRDMRLVRVQANTPAFQIPLDAPSPIRESVGVVVKEGEIVHIANVALGPQHLLAEVVEAVEVEVGEELDCEVADGETAPPLEGGEEVVA